MLHKSLLSDADVSPQHATAMSAPGGTTTAAVISGNDGDNNLNGSSGADTISGGEGGDTINGGDGADTLYGFGSEDVNPDVGQIDAHRVAAGLDQSVFAASPPGDPDRLFIIEQHTGEIKILDLAASGGPALLSTPFLNIDDNDIGTGGEQGLLGLAFSPDYATSGKYYIYLTDAAGDNQVWQYTRGGNADVSSTTHQLVLTIPHPGQANHNGGWMGFGPDNNLYIATGDGGGGGDVPNNAQNIDSLLGKILRIDPSSDQFPGDPNRNYSIPNDNPFVGHDGADEIFAMGLRNPWRNSFDSVTGDFWIGDVGQGAFEEINFVPAGTLGGRNFGWHVMEGTHVYDDGTPGNPAPGDPSLTDPIYDYAHGDGPFDGNVVTGGYVIHSPDAGGQGLYIFADFGSNNLWTLRSDGSGSYTDLMRRNDQIQVDAGTFNDIGSFAVDGSGRVYVVSHHGEIFQLNFNAGAGDANDVLNGGNGPDKLYGGIGDDVLSGGGGADQIFGGAGVDTATYRTSVNGVHVALNGGVSTGGEGGGDRFQGVENLIGSAHNDTLRGSSSANVLNGGGDNDTLIGLGGADTLIGGAGTDTAYYSNATAGVTVNLTTRTGSGNQAQGDTYQTIENVVGSNANDTLTGNIGANQLEGHSGADRLMGAAGNDTLIGGLGGDTLIGGNNNDTLNGNGGHDTMTGGSGADGFVFDASLIAGNADTITDFGNGADEIRLSHNVFTGLATGALSNAAFHVGASAADASDWIIYNSSTGALYFDVDGTGGQAQMQFATLLHAPTLNAGDFLVI